MTKAALLKEAQTREQLRKEFVLMQDAVKATEFLIPFVFFDGSNIPGGTCRVKKGDRVWLFLDRSRKIGADRGVSGSGEKQSNARREWARVSVDDLLLVRGDLIIPHVSCLGRDMRDANMLEHYEFYYFIVNKTLGSNSKLLFPYSDKPTDATPSTIASPTATPEPSNYNPLSRPAGKKEKEQNVVTIDDARLEGSEEDPTLTKVVDRRWYERNKHIFPANVWEEFDPTKDYSTALRKDASGNTFFF
jgi:protein FAM50